MSMLTKIHSVLIAVENLEETTKLFCDTYGLEVLSRGEEPELGQKDVNFRIGDAVLGLRAPLDYQHPQGRVARFLQTHGQGLYMLGFQVASGSADSIVQSFKEKGMQLVWDSDDPESLKRRRTQHPCLLPQPRTGGAQFLMVPEGTSRISGFYDHRKKSTSMLIKIHMVVMAVENLEETTKLFCDTYGLEVYSREDEPHYRHTGVNFPIGDVLIRLDTPLDYQHPQGRVARFLQTHGEGLYKLEFEVASGSADSIVQSFKAKGMQLIWDGDDPESLKRRTAGHPVLLPQPRTGGAQFQMVPEGTSLVPGFYGYT